VSGRGTVAHFIDAADAQAVAAEILRIYGRECRCCEPDRFIRFQKLVDAARGEASDMTVRVRLLPADDGSDWYDVDLIDNDDNISGFGGIAWGALKPMPVAIEGRPMTIGQVAAHLFYEMTYHGWQEP